MTAGRKPRFHVTTTQVEVSPEFCNDDELKQFRTHADVAQRTLARRART